MLSENDDADRVPPSPEDGWNSCTSTPDSRCFLPGRELRLPNLLTEKMMAGMELFQAGNKFRE
jgi:hypothetical protein